MTSDVKKHATIFAEYQRRLYRYVDQARDAQRVRVGSGQDATPDILRARNEQDTVYATIKGNKPADGLILIETTQERSIRKACESLAAHLIERIQNTFPAYDGGGVQGHAHLDAEKLVIDLDGEIPNDVKDIALNLLRSPPQLLRTITTFTARIVNLINRETEKIDVRTDAERLRLCFWAVQLSGTFLDISGLLHLRTYGLRKSTPMQLREE